MLNKEKESRKVADIVFRDDLYPRIESSFLIVQKYAEDLSVLPPIEVNQHNELIDGWHRWMAHKKKGTEEIEVIVTHTSGDAEVLELAITRNAAFGLQLSASDKKKMARRIYRETASEDRGAKKKRLAKILSMSGRTVDAWLSRIDKDTREERNAAVQNLYLQDRTQEYIAAATGMSRGAVEKVLLRIAEFQIGAIPGQFAEDLPDESATDTVKKEAEQERQRKIKEQNVRAASHDTDFDVPVFNSWRQQSKSEGSEHFGNSEMTWVDRLLYLYTKPFDVVVDPFAGGGSTIDICKKRFRRCFASDRKPIVEREKEIRLHDLKDGPLKPPQCKGVKLVYLDPPYWRQAAGQYSDDPEDLANQSIEVFTTNLTKIVMQYAAMLSDAYIALMIQPTQWKAPNRGFVDHVGDLLRLVKLPVEMRYSVPYESQQCNAQMVTWAKENRKCLVLTREIIVWRVE